jgi:hypothetical protein
MHLLVFLIHYFHYFTEQANVDRLCEYIGRLALMKPKVRTNITETANAVES